MTASMGLVTVRHIGVPIEGWPRGADGLRIAHLSDLHLHSWNKVMDEAQRLLLGLEYDLAAVTGDLCGSPQDWRRTAELLRRFFAPVYAPLGVFAVLGNHDAPILADQADLNLTFLRDRVAMVHREGAAVAVVGVEQTHHHRGDPEAVLTQVPPGVPAVVLAHYPSTAHKLLPGRVGLILAGHTHGGQIRLPLLGCLWTNDRISRHRALGLTSADGTHLHVSGGLGVSGPIRIRMFCPPEITVLTLRKAETAGTQAIRPAQLVALAEQECETRIAS